jgi:hypothetical protein
MPYLDVKVFFLEKSLSVGHIDPHEREISLGAIASHKDQGGLLGSDSGTPDQREREQERPAPGVFGCCHQLRNLLLEFRRNGWTDLTLS